MSKFVWASNNLDFKMRLYQIKSLALEFHLQRIPEGHHNLTALMNDGNMLLSTVHKTEKYTNFGTIKKWKSCLAAM